MNGEVVPEQSFVLKSMNAVEAQFCDAAFLGDVKTLSKLIAEGIDVNCRDNIGQTALHRACSKGNYEAVKLLVANGANVDLYDWNMVTPLHFAAKGNHLLVTKFLVMSGAKLTIQCRSGCVPIDFAFYDSDTWKVLYNAAKGILPSVDYLRETRDVPLVPQYAIPASKEGGSKKGKKSGKKGKKGKKSGKKGGKKSGKKKKK